LLNGDYQILRDEGKLIRIETNPKMPLHAQIAVILEQLHQHSVLSVLVEAGPRLQKAFIESGLWDEIRVFTSPATLSAGLPAPLLPVNAHLWGNQTIGGDQLRMYRPAVQMRA
jgi:diaminohydroxyphosphoribosylaminopyrimidine deaminase/5-amino-6-(5-phosphoribosylamino)uracil reductase